MEFMNRPMAGITEPDALLQLLLGEVLFKAGPAMHLARNKMMKGERRLALAKFTLGDIRVLSHVVFIARNSRASQPR